MGEHHLLVPTTFEMIPNFSDLSNSAFAWSSNAYGHFLGVYRWVTFFGPGFKWIFILPPFIGFNLPSPGSSKTSEKFFMASSTLTFGSSDFKVLVPDLESFWAGSPTIFLQSAFGRGKFSDMILSRWSALQPRSISFTSEDTRASTLVFWPS